MIYFTLITQGSTAQGKIKVMIANSTGWGSQRNGVRGIKRMAQFAMMNQTVREDMFALQQLQ